MSLRRLKPLERQVQNAVLALLRLMPEVAWAHKVAVGEWVIIRPLGTESVRKQLQPAINLGIIGASQVGYMQGAPEGVLDIALQLKGMGSHCEIEVKQPGKKPSDEQMERILLVRENGGLADWVDDVEKAQELIKKWHGNPGLFVPNAVAC